MDAVDFVNDRALHADAIAELGGAAFVGSNLLVLSRNWRGLGVIAVAE